MEKVQQWLWVAIFCVLCSSIAYAVDTQKIETLHVVFSNHLDIGFDGIPNIGYAFNVINRYFEVYFPRAWDTSEWFLEHRNEFNDTYTWTTQPFLLYLYLNCHKFPSPWPYPPPGRLNVPPPEPLACPTPEDLQRMKESISKRGVSWQAFPFNSETEMYDESLFLSQLETAFSLSSSYNVPKVLTMSQRDVPGVTRAVIPLLRSKGIEAISVGVNGGSAPPAVPRIFRWLDKASNKDLIAMWNPGGYGGIQPENLISIPGCPDAMLVAFKSDNQGPHTVKEVQDIFSYLREQYPGVNVRNAIFDDFVQVALKYKQNLETIDSEIGDTWIYGCSSDPVKVAQYRSALRLRSQCINSGQCSLSDPQMQFFDFTIGKIAEHTWGCDIKEFPNDWTHWSNTQLQDVRKSRGFQIAEMSWIEQRSFLSNALYFLQSGPYLNLHKNILADWKAIADVSAPNLAGYTNLQDKPVNMVVNGWSIATDVSTGAINHLSANGVQWADSNHMLGYYQYKTYDSNTYNYFFHNYSYILAPWVSHDFGKFNVSEAKPLHASYNATRTQCYYKLTNNQMLSVWTELSLPQITQTAYGAPKSIWVNMQLNTVNQSINFEVLLLNKTATRLPETHFFSFNPLTAGKGGMWSMSILGSGVDPSNIVKNGSHILHGVDEGGVYYSGGGKSDKVRIRSIDSAVVNAGEATGFPTPFNNPDLNKGWSYHLFNNLWGTNYIMWFPFYKGDENLRYRFEVTF